ncbi:hypothetical protein [Deinococcus humi]|uniref:Uncharacterized protein n=1 Tax=Deinococcus humi TaxID=662880 RepID=A0A7W8JSP7_9DEIO|nr:hypothetical protein [Deinococcus humi]MBB5360969.1 hypothetical protein [Deinococcus humi]
MTRPLRRLLPILLGLTMLLSACGGGDGLAPAGGHIWDSATWDSALWQ